MQEKSTAPDRIAVKVRPAAERSIRNGHPWIYEDSIVKQSKVGAAGDLAILFDQKKNKFLAAGLYDPDSPIRIKLLQFEYPATIDADWFLARVQTAYQLRQPLLATDTNSYRLLYGENDGLPSLVADVYGQVLVLKLYSAAWYPYLEFILNALQRVSNCETIVLRLARRLERLETTHRAGLGDGQLLRGGLTENPVTFREHGLRFAADPVRGHKTGYFLDHRHNRKRVGALAAGKRVLDVFAYAGGFSVHALAGGAQMVTSLDISAPALQQAQANVALNFDAAPHQVVVGDAFSELRALADAGKQYELVVIDPPAFAKQQSEVPGALHSYGRLAELGLRLVTPGGVLMLASCSSRVSTDQFYHTVEAKLQRRYPNFQVLEKTQHDIDHPIRIPEGAYLKAGFWQLR